MKTRRVLLLALVAFVAFGASGCGYNTLVTKQQNVRRSWGDIESTLQRRADLVPNLVAAAQSAGVNEQEIFGQIATARRRRASARRTNCLRPTWRRSSASSRRLTGWKCRRKGSL